MISPIANVKLPTSGILSFGFVRSDTHIHRGIDIPAKLGTPVRAAASGVVEHAHQSLAPGFSGYGAVVVVRMGQNGPWQLYAHLDKVLVQKGQTVLEGQQIGTVGRSCFNKTDPKKLCDGPHLHFEVSPRPYPQDSEASRMDPVAWIQGGGAAGLGLLVLAGLGFWWWKRRRA